ncbi:hypothetical protein CDAR_502221 [Caerostris darwini]|uniref:Uncharacterized protein n=1 Tax=Caerostris darwini TaxID=1538125 RepID=A0AAV4R8B7_9ARAC|nr:hypothetical protein CDAR_502221 [Caerostris darwini]
MMSFAIFFDKSITKLQNLEHFTTEKRTTKPYASRLYAQNGSYRDGWKREREKCHNNPQIQILVTNHQTGHGTEGKGILFTEKAFANLEDSKSLSFHTHKGKAV